MANYSTGRRGVQYGSSTQGSGGFSVKGSQDFLAISKRLKQAGEKDLRNEFHKAVQAAAKPLLPKVKEAARVDLPKKGGLNERTAKKPLKTQTRTGAQTAGVRIVGTKVDPRINDGRVWHPIFGRKGKAPEGKKNSVIQNVPAAKGYFDKTLSESGPEVQQVVQAVMQDWTQNLLRGRY